MEEEDWCQWIKHDGSGCPLENGTLVEIVGEGHNGWPLRQVGNINTNMPLVRYAWSWKPGCAKVLHYRYARSQVVKDLMSLINNVETLKGNLIGD